MKSVDGFPIDNAISFLPDAPDTSINRWSFDRPQKVEVADFYLNPRRVKWKEKAVMVGDYGLFTGMISDWIRRDKLSKEQALDLWFSAA